MTLLLLALAAAALIAIAITDEIRLSRARYGSQGRAAFEAAERRLLAARAERTNRYLRSEFHDTV
jgi:hypothetical protein